MTDDVGREGKIGLTIAGIFFVGFLGWAAVAPLAAGAHASGVVAVSGNRQSVQHRDGGVVSALRVKEGDRVRAGQVLLEIDANDLGASERALAAQVIGRRIQHARLIAERDGRTAITVPADLAKVSAQDRPLLDEALAAQTNQLLARRAAMANERAVLVQRIAQLNSQVQGFNGQLVSTREQQALLEDDLTGLRSLAQKGFVAQTRVRSTERAAAGLRGDLGTVRSNIAKSQDAMGETRLQIASIDRRLQEEVAEQLRLVETDLSELEPKWYAARVQVDRLRVRAPVSGQIVGLSVFTVGGVVMPGQGLMDIVPDAAPLVVEARIQPSDADDVHPGQQAEVRFTALKQRTLPLVMGKVTRLSADRFVDKQTGQAYFTAEVVVPPKELEQLKKISAADAGVRAGLPVEIIIPLGSRSLLDYLISPLRDTLWRGMREQ
jgi:HlyD family secretion protein